MRMEDENYSRMHDEDEDDDDDDDDEEEDDNDADEDDDEDACWTSETLFRGFFVRGFKDVVAEASRLRLAVDFFSRRAGRLTLFKLKGVYTINSGMMLRSLLYSCLEALCCQPVITS